MDHFAKLIAALVLSFAGTAHAGYAQARPPSGWSPGNYAPSANDSVYGRVIYSPNGPTTTVGGQAVKMPAAYRLAANAPRIAAAVIFANPHLRVGVGIAAWLLNGKLVWDSAEQIWRQISEPSSADGVEYQDAANASAPWRSNPSAACSDAASRMTQAADSSWLYTFASFNGSSCVLKLTINGKYFQDSAAGLSSRPTTGQQCPTGWTRSPAGCLSPALTQPQLVELLNPANQPGWPMPQPVPLELPQPTPLPIEKPSPYINPLPGPDPQHLPRFVPSGDPVPNPKYNPDAPPGPNNPPYIQPGTRVVPSPTPSQPWRVDHQPVNRPQDDATPKPNPDAEPGTNPADKPKPEEQQSLCEKHPDIVACAKLGEPGQATPVPNETKTLTIAPENGFGPSGASCPPPRTVQVAGLTLSMPFDLLCDFATGLKPVIVGLAWLSAAFAFMGIGRRS